MTIKSAACVTLTLKGQKHFDKEKRVKGRKKYEEEIG